MLIERLSDTATVRREARLGRWSRSDSGAATETLRQYRCARTRCHLITLYLYYRFVAALLTRRH